MIRRSLLWGLASGVLTVFLSGCALAEDKAPDYRYRLTVEVETPEGLRTGSSVIEVHQTLVRAGGSPANQAVSWRLRGEAVAVDLPNGKTLFALLRSDNDPDWASRIYILLAPQNNEEFEDALSGVTKLTGKRTLPRMWPPVAFLEERSAYPIMVAFADLADPASVAIVDPDNLEATFGKGVRLKRITVELTNAPVTTGIEKRLRWWGMSLKNFENDDFPIDLPVGDFNGLFKKDSE
jgi:hypothetical protein